MMPRSTQGVEAEFGGFDNLQMLVVGDADSMHPEHAVEFFQLGKKDGAWDTSGISNARLAILPGVTHYNIFSSRALLPTVTPFLDAPMPQTSEKIQVRRVDSARRGSSYE